MAETVAREAPLKPITVSIKVASEISGLGPTTLWGLVKDGVLEVCRIGRRTLVRVDSLERLLVPDTPPPEAAPRRRGRPPKVVRAIRGPVQ